MSAKVKPPTIPVMSPVAVLIVWVAALLCAMFPLTGTAGPEAAQVLGVVGGLSLLFAGAARGSYRQSRGFSGDLTMQALTLGIAFVGFVIVIMVASLGHESCAPGRGWLPFFFLSLPVMLLCSATGLLIGRLTGQPTVAVLATVVVVLAYAAWLTADFYFAPSFRFLSHFSVVLDGDMLRGRGVHPAVVGYRLATLLFAVGFIGVGITLFPRQQTGGLAGPSRKGPSWVIPAGLCFLVGVVAHVRSKDEIVQSRGELSDTYRLEKAAPGVLVKADPAALTARDVEAVLAESTLWLQRLEARLKVGPTEPITIYLHKDRDALAYWTGAEHVHFALPWKREIHISHAAVPHGSLGHELAHIVAGEWSDGMFAVPSRFLFLVNTGVVEGVAMAATPELKLDNELTLKEQAAALRRADLAPPLEDLFGGAAGLFGFWRHAPGRAYVTAGALIQSILEAKGPDAVRAIYASGDLGAGFKGADALDKFVAEHEQDLDELPLPKDALFSVKTSYARPSILDETCDPDQKAAREDILGYARSQDFGRAEQAARQVEDPITAPTLEGLADIARDQDDDIRALAYLQQAIQLTDDPRRRLNLLDEAADLLVGRGRFRDAQATYGRMPLEVASPAAERLVQAKSLLNDRCRRSAGKDELARAALVFLSRDPRHGDDTTRMIGLSGALSEYRGDDKELVGFVRYLLARQYIQRGAPDEGLDLLLRNHEERITLPGPFDEQALRGLAMAHARRGDFGVAALGFAHIADKSDRPAVRVRMRDFAERAEKAAGSAFEGAQWLFGTDRAGGF